VCPGSWWRRGNCFFGQLVVPVVPTGLYCAPAPSQLLMDATATLSATYDELQREVVVVRAQRKAAAAAAAAGGSEAVSGSVAAATPLDPDGDSGSDAESVVVTPGERIGGLMTWPPNSCVNVQVGRPQHLRGGGAEPAPCGKGGVLWCVCAGPSRLTPCVPQLARCLCARVLLLCCVQCLLLPQPMAAAGVISAVTVRLSPDRDNSVSSSFAVVVYRLNDTRGTLRCAQPFHVDASVLNDAQSISLDRVLTVEAGEHVGIVAVRGMLGLAAASSGGGGRAYSIVRHASPGDALNCGTTVKFTRTCPCALVSLPPPPLSAPILVQRWFLCMPPRARVPVPSRRRFVLHHNPAR
jgi:hypothetical protein